MYSNRYKYSHQLILFFIILFCPNCQVKNNSSNNRVQSLGEPLPYSDPENKGGWVLNEHISDEFDGKELDNKKWFIEGENNEYYIWKGRPPSQYVPHNAFLENGKLKIRTQWEPKFKFLEESYKDGENNDTYGKFDGKDVPITTAGIISKKRFLYGYMEVKAKIGNAAMTCAFWALGYEQELDVFELMGNPKIEGKIKADTYLATAHDWSPPAERPTKVFNHIEKLPFRVAENFHIYGAEWGKDFLKLYIDGRLVYHFTQDQVGLDWVLNNPMEIWIDSETFKWLGLPHKEELPVDFEVEYMRVWQKPSNNLLAKDAAFYGFEGPILYEDNPRPLDMVPEDSKPNDYQKFWIFDEASSKYLKIVEGDYATGVESLKFTGYGKNQSLEVEKVIVKSPKSSLNLPSGKFTMSMKVWLDQGRVADKIHILLRDPRTVITFSGLKKLKRRTWITIKESFNRTKASSDNDGMEIEIRKGDLPPTKAAKLFIDDITIQLQ